MGAELILAALPAARLTPARRRRLHTLVDRLPERSLRRLSLEDLAVAANDRRQALHELIDQLPTHPLGTRGVTVLQFTLRALPRMVTGGISYGDDPTDLVPVFTAVAQVPALVRQLAAWTRHDTLARRHHD
jgi:hypothetical protein